MGAILAGSWRAGRLSGTAGLFDTDFTLRSGDEPRLTRRCVLDAGAEPRWVRGGV